MSKTDLKIDWATHEAARYAVENWHYSRTMPKSKLVKIGVWEENKYIGVVLYGVGGVPGMYKRYGISDTEGCELVRIALKHHVHPVSQIVAISLKMLKRVCSKIKIVLSFADQEQGHIGSIYQAGNWIYTGESQSSDEYIFKGKRWHGRAFRHRFKGMEHDESVQIVKGSCKHRYLMPLDKEMRKQILPLSKPYPKRVQSIDGDAPGHQPGEGGSTPTCALQLSQQP